MPVAFGNAKRRVVPLGYPARDTRGNEAIIVRRHNEKGYSDGTRRNDERAQCNLARGSPAVRYELTANGGAIARRHAVQHQRIHIGVGGLVRP